MRMPVSVFDFTPRSIQTFSIEPSIPLLFAANSFAAAIGLVKLGKSNGAVSSGMIAIKNSRRLVFGIVSLSLPKVFYDFHNEVTGNRKTYRKKFVCGK